MGTIRAITFDLWDTLVVDDSDEPKRKARGLDTKAVARRTSVWEALHAEHPDLRREDVFLAYDVAETAFRRVWHDQHVTWTVPERIDVVLKGLKRTLSEAALRAVITAHERMEVEIPPDPMPGIGPVLEELHGRYALAVISDAIVTPGRELRRLLEGHDLARHFDAFVFSDEVGRSKPHRSVFDAAASALGVGLHEIAHVGDRQHNDVAGAQAVGAKAVLFVGSRAIDRAGNTADAVCEHATELPGAISEL